MKWAGAAYGVAMCMAVALFAARRPEVITAARPVTPPRRGFVTNLASLGSGARVRVSNYDAFRGHHPLFAIDEELRPTAEEKWASLPDRAPAFLEVIFAARATVSWVSLTLAGAYEAPIFTARSFDLVCLRDGREIARAPVRENLQPQLKAMLSCASTDRVRVEFPVENPPLDRARLYEIEVWGALE